MRHKKGKYIREEKKRGKRPSGTHGWSVSGWSNILKVVDGYSSINHPLAQLWLLPVPKTEGIASVTIQLA